MTIVNIPGEVDFTRRAVPSDGETVVILDENAEKILGPIEERIVWDAKLDDPEFMSVARYVYYEDGRVENITTWIPACVLADQ